jgi:hydrophobic/amphiphilic exporter-1 (mainly G- bacteria), HAE1 family
MTVTELAIKRPSLIVVLFSFLGVLGIFGFTQLKYDLMPKMTAPVITITTIYPGGSPNEVETSITKVIENAVTGLDKINTLRSQSSEGRSFVYVEFDQSVDVNIALQDAQRHLNEIADRLPLAAKKPVLSKISFDEIPVLRMAVRSTLSSKEFYQFIQDNVYPRITKIGGVGAVTLLGAEEREIRVNIDLQKVRNYGLSLFNLTQAIKAGNVDFPTGKVTQAADQFTVRVAGKYGSLDELRDLVVARSRQGSEIRVRDIADVEDGVKEITNINRLNGTNSIGLTVQKQSDANTVEVSRNVRQELKLLEKDYANEKLAFDIAQDGSVFTMASANAVKEDLAIAIVLVAFVMLIFLHSLRNSLIVMVAIPASLVSTFFAMYIFDFTLNLMTLLAMSLVIGILVDDSIVVLENIYRHLEMGQDQRSAALRGRNEIGFAAISITLVDVVVFLPLSFITGMIGNFLREYALVVVFSTLMSLIVSFTITPLLASRFTKLEHLTAGTLMGRFGTWFENFFRKTTGYYKRALIWSLGNGGKVAIMTVMLFIVSIALVPMGFIGNEFIPVVDRGELNVTVELEPGSTLQNTNYVVLRAEKILSAIPEVEKVLSNVGQTSEGFIGVYTNNNAELYVTLVDKHQRSDATDVIGQRIKKKLMEMPGVKVRVNPISLMGTNSRSPIQIVVTATNSTDALKGANVLQKVIKGIVGTTDVRLSTEEGKPELVVDIDRKKMAALGLSIMDVGQNLRIALTGDDDSKYREGVNEYAIRILLDEYNRNDPQTVSNLTFMNGKGQQVELKQFARVYQSLGPTKLERENRISSVMVYSQVFGKTSGIIAQEIRRRMATVSMPQGVAFDFVGEQKTMADSFKSLLVALLAGILFVYMIMVALYDSYVYPFVVLFSIPVAMVGALFGLALAGKSISIYSMLGIIMLVGLVAKNAILLVDRTNQMKLDEGTSTYDALLEAGQTRLRPILMTTFAMVMGMTPIALSTSAGSEAKSGLAIVLIGGLLSSLLLTLVLVPVVYQKIDKIKKRIKN